MRKSCLALLLTLCALFTLTASAEPLEQLPDLAGTVYWPEGTDADSAVYVYTYAYPQVAGEGEAVEAINKSFADLVADSLEFDVSRRGEEIADTSAQSHTEITYRVTANDGEFFSLLVFSDTTMEGQRFVSVKAQVFSLDTGKAGHQVTLPYLLGILEDDSDDDWLRDRQTQRAEEIIRMLILDEIESRRARGEAIPEEIDEELLAYDFYPEEDFYYDGETGSVVFFLQPFLNGEGMAPDDFYTFAFDAEEILDEM